MHTLYHHEIDVIEATIRQCSVCFIGVVDANNLPYVLPMNFGYHNKTIYLHSAPAGKIIDALNRNPNICITFCPPSELVAQHPEVACSFRMRGKSIVVNGVVRFVEDRDEKRNVFDILMGQYTKKTFAYSDPAIKNVKVWEVKVDDWTCKEFGTPPNTYPNQREMISGHSNKP